MAYQNKYKATFATKSGKTAYLYLQEEDYTGELIEYIGVSLEYQYIPESDNPMEVVYASQISCTLDVTDDLENIPDFTTLNDRKYFTKLYLDDELQFFGFTLSDSVQIPFNTGRKHLSFNAIDGVGMLKDIRMPFSESVNINDINSLLYYLTTAINTLNFPITPNIVTICSIYAEGMETRDDHSYSEPFSQTYIPYRTFLQDPNIYITCYDVIVNILRSFGCRFFIANGKWYMANINDIAADEFYYTEYDYLGNVVSSGTMNTLSTIEGFTGNTSNLYFIDSTQTKIFRKGYNKIIAVVDVATSANYLSNGNLRPMGASFPLNWTAGNTTGSTWQVISKPNETSDAFKLYKKNTSGSYVYVENQSLPKVNEGDLFNFTWTYYSQDVVGIRGYVIVELRIGSSVYYYTDNGWVTSGPVNAFQVPAYSTDPTSVSQKNDVTFSTKIPAPIAGVIYFQFRLEEGTCQNVEIGGFIMTTTPVLKQITYTAYISNSSQYVYDISIPYGSYSPSANFPSEFGIFLTPLYNAYINWFSYGNPTTYTSLLGLLTRQYINVFGKNIINIDCSLSSFDTNNGLLNGAKIFKADDTDPAQINVSNNYYMLGNSTINYPSDETYATLLQINGEDVDATFEYTLTYNQ